jgi:type IV secretion system protein VirD4
MFSRSSARADQPTRNSTGRSDVTSAKRTNSAASPAATGPRIGLRPITPGQVQPAEPVQTRDGSALLVIGPTGSGKTVALGFIINEFEGPVVVLSGKTDLLAATITSRLRRGEVWTFDPSGVTGRAGDGFDLLAWCRTLEAAIEAAGLLVAAGAGRGITDSEFWYSLARRLLAVMLYAAAVNGYTLDDVYRWALTEDRSELQSLLQAAGDETAVYMLDSVFNREERTYSSIFATLQQLLIVFDRLTARQATSGGPIDMGVLLGLAAEGARSTSQELTQMLHARDSGWWDLPEPVAADGGARTLYATLPVHQMQDYGALVTMLVKRMVKVAREHETTGKRLPATALLIVDEAASATRLPLLEWTATLRSSGICLISSWQSLGQLDQSVGTSGTDMLLENSTAMLLGGARPTPTSRRLASWLAGHDRSLLYGPTESSTGSTAASPAVSPLPPQQTVEQAAAAAAATKLTVDTAAHGLAQLPQGSAVVLDGPRIQRVMIPAAAPQIGAEQATTPYGLPDRGGPLRAP